MTSLLRISVSVYLHIGMGSAATGSSNVTSPRFFILLASFKPGFPISSRDEVIVPPIALVNNTVSTALVCQAVCATLHPR